MKTLTKIVITAAMAAIPVQVSGCAFTHLYTCSRPVVRIPEVGGVTQVWIRRDGAVALELKESGSLGFRVIEAEAFCGWLESHGMSSERGAADPVSVVLHPFTVGPLLDGVGEKTAYRTAKPDWDEDDVVRRVRGSPDVEYFDYQSGKTTYRVACWTAIGGNSDSNPIALVGCMTLDILTFPIQAVLWCAVGVKVLICG